MKIRVTDIGVRFCAAAMSSWLVRSTSPRIRHERYNTIALILDPLANLQSITRLPITRLSITRLLGYGRSPNREEFFQPPHDDDPFEIAGVAMITCPIGSSRQLVFEPALTTKMSPSSLVR